MPEYDPRLLIQTGTVTAWDVQCRGLCRVKADEELVEGTRLVFPYHGVYVHWVGTRGHVAEPNQMVILNENEPYRVSHPIAGGDATLTVGVEPATLLEVLPSEYRSPYDRPALNRPVLQVDADTQVLAAQLRQQLSRGSVGSLESEALALRLVRHALGDDTSRARQPNGGRPAKMVNHVKLLLSADPWRRWTLAEIAREVSVTPVYLTDAFRRVEGIPLYRYHLRLRLALALTVLPECGDLTTLAIELGFHSHSHFSSAFKKTFGRTPSEFKRSIAYSRGRVTAERGSMPKDLDSAVAYMSRSVSSGCRKAKQTPRLSTKVVA
ncbi:AraC family transcriptional regulator [Mycobacterium interjectum]|uniref:AraC family transcriptional regulator n=1 Tax=Mycobacterium interjectum TaxID=33895 RepID=UPI0009FE7EA0|nr:AraC family transcriptional regulator [Mycobacterium interjectum]MCV7090105.1 helix-turn-helix transcriptional regulator [Mycobacterium interjectum]